MAGRLIPARMVGRKSDPLTPGSRKTASAMAEPPVMELLSGAPVLVVAFGGINHGIGIGVPPFEFLRSLSAQGCDAIFVRDPLQAWYQLGIDGVAPDVVGIAQWLRARRRGYQRAAAVGNSMGGHAALLFGWLAEFDIMMAFSPQTTIAASDRMALGDRRWQALIERVHAQSSAGRYYDVREVLSSLGGVEGGERTSLLFFGANDREDASHAMRLAGEPGCHLFAVKDSRHQAVRALRDAGILTRMFGMVCDPAIGLPTLLDDLRLDDRLASVGGTRSSSCAGGKSAEP